jgi:SAM-dependent methyltransferase
MSIIAATPDSEVRNSLRQEGAAIRFYDDRYRHGYMDDWSADKCARIASVLAELRLPAHGRALDFGCGSGMFTRVLRRALPRWDIEGTDLSAVAVETAARRLPDARFFPLADCDRITGRYDLIFTHHVLEHVGDLAATARSLARMSRPSASMLHVLPCGNAGSLEHDVCLLRVDGIRTEPERLFFFEEDGHLRRLDTAAITALWEQEGYRLGHHWYAAHHVGSLQTRTSFGLGDVLAFTDPERAVDEAARRKLQRLRRRMVALWAIRKPVAVVRNKKTHGFHTARDYVLFAGSLAVYPVAASVEQSLRYLESREWRARRNDPSGSEMFIQLIRG